MALVGGKDKGEIKKFSGGELYVLAVTDAGPAGDEVEGDWKSLGYIQESTLNDTTDIEEIQDETGNTVMMDEATRVVKFTGLLMQTSKDIIDFLKEDVRGVFYSVYHYDGVNNAFYQEQFFGICRIKPMIEIASGTKRIPLEISVLNNDAAITYGGSGNAALPVVKKAAAATIPINNYYTVVETAVS